jgi:tetratricopeptide (TPR) repeat protein
MKRIGTFIIAAAVGAGLSSCSTLRGMMGSDGTAERQAPINNPFGDYYYGPNANKESVILRTKKGDRSVEVELPGSTGAMTDFVVPVSPAFQDGGRPAMSADGATIDEKYMERHPSISDREITSHFNQAGAGNEAGRREVETGLGVMPAEDETPQHDRSYLAGIDHVKQLYRLARYEAALLEVDEMLRIYPTDAKLYEMRGTLFDRIGRADLAIKSWNQALRFDPANEALKRFVDRRQQTQSGSQKRGLASP